MRGSETLKCLSVEVCVRFVRITVAVLTLNSAFWRYAPFA